MAVRSRIRSQVMRFPLVARSRTLHANLRIVRSFEGGAKWAVQGLNNGVQHTPSREPCDRPDQVLTYVAELLDRMEREI